MKYTFLVRANKTLLPTSKIVINQKDANADTLAFIIPKSYNGIQDVYEDCFITLKFITAGNISVAKQLSSTGELYKEDYYLYTYKIDNEFSDVAGDVRIQLEILSNETRFSLDEFPIKVRNIDAAFTSTDDE